MHFAELDVLRWVHIICMVYWLGGEWGVFQTSFNIINRKLSMEERRRHMETAYRIDILARTGIIMLLPLGLHPLLAWVQLVLLQPLPILIHNCIKHTDLYLNCPPKHRQTSEN